MLLLSNTSTDDPMELGMDTLNHLIDTCPRLCCVGNLRTWSRIDYYDPNSDNYFKSEESNLGNLKRRAVEKNWDLDLDSENLDYLYTNIL